MYIVNMIVRSTNNKVFLGLSRTSDGYLKILRHTFPKKTHFERKMCSRTGILYQMKDSPDIWIQIRNHSCEWEGNMGWVITKRNNETNSEEIYALFDNKNDAIKFIEINVDEPHYIFKPERNETDVEGYIPFSRIIGDDNTELNRVHYTIYETEVKE